MTQQLHKPVGIIGGKYIMPHDELLQGQSNIHNFKYIWAHLVHPIIIALL